MHRSTNSGNLDERLPKCIDSRLTRSQMPPRVLQPSSRAILPAEISAFVQSHRLCWPQRIGTEPVRFPRQLFAQIISCAHNCRRRFSLNRHWQRSLCISATVHVLTLVLLAQWSLNALSPVDGDAIETRWTPATTPAKFQEVQATVAVSATQQTSSGSSNSGVHFFQSSPHQSRDLAPRWVASPLTAHADIEDCFPPRLSDQVGVLVGGGLATASIGSGVGVGDGDGQGTSGQFFGLQAKGKRFVYVVDCSKSMRHPYPGRVKSRFGRLKVELVHSLQSMQPEMQFFIVFFNDRAIPMPARALQPADPEVTLRYLQWAAQVPADGETDPREALLLALQLRPDVIYFLTDGDFEYRVVREVTQANLGRTSIHTFCLADPEGEEFLRLIAQQNNGEYHYIP